MQFLKNDYLKDNTASATCGAGTAYPSRVGFVWLDRLVFYVVFFTSLLIFFHLIIALSVLLLPFVQHTSQRSVVGNVKAMLFQKLFVYNKLDISVFIIIHYFLNIFCYNKIECINNICCTIFKVFAFVVICIHKQYCYHLDKTNVLLSYHLYCMIYYNSNIPHYNHYLNE